MTDYAQGMIDDLEVALARDRATEARHGGRYITGALARAINNDGIRARFAGEDGPEALAEIWRYTASPSGSTTDGRDTTQRYARSAAAIGGVDWEHSAYWQAPLLPEAAFDWPIYRAAIVNDVYGALWGQASEAEERVLDTLAHCAGLDVALRPV